MAIVTQGCHKQSPTLLTPRAALLPLDYTALAGPKCYSTKTLDHGAQELLEGSYGPVLVSLAYTVKNKAGCPLPRSANTVLLLTSRGTAGPSADDRLLVSQLLRRRVPRSRVSSEAR